MLDRGSEVNILDSATTLNQKMRKFPYVQGIGVGRVEEGEGLILYVDKKPQK